MAEDIINWNEEKFNKFIQLRGIDYAKYFGQNRHFDTVREGWRQIKNELETNLPNDILAKKWDALVKKYKRIFLILHNKTNEYNQTDITWPHYDLMNTVFKDRIICSSPTSFDEVNMKIKSIKQNKVLILKDIKKKKLKPDKSFNIDLELENLCGVVFATKDFSLTFKCSFCQKTFVSARKFSNHLKNNHFDYICDEQNDKDLNSNKSNKIETENHKNVVPNERKNEFYNESIPNIDFELVSMDGRESGHDNIYIEENELEKSNPNSIHLENINVKEEEFSGDEEKFSNVVLCGDEDQFISENNEKFNETIKDDENCKATELEAQNINDFLCSLCNKAFFLRSSFTNHMNRHKDIFKCDMCDRSFNCLYSKNRHIKTLHSNEIIVCSNSNNLIKTEIIHNKVTKVKNLKTFKCNWCDKKFSIRSSFTNHIKRHVNQGRIKCEICSKGFNSIHDRKKHLQEVHKSSKISKDFKEIEIIKIKKGDTNNFTNQLENFNNNKRYLCEYCNTLFKTKNGRDNHKTLCVGGRKNFKCEICNKILTSKAGFKRHLIVHQGLKPHKCQICEKSFPVLGSLNTHIKRHIGDKRYQCDFCEKKFVCKEDKKIHERFHKNEKPFLCTKCGKCFSTRSHLAVHFRRHTGIKPYKCEHCDKSFYTLDLLKDHSVKHSGLRPHICKVCNATFKRKGTLRHHEKRHSDIGTYSCKICNKLFKQRIPKSHMQSHFISEQSNE